MKKQNLYRFLFLLTLEFILHSERVFADRVKGYSGWNAPIRGDSMTVGMSGVNFIIPNNVSASFYNPAGLSMSMASVDAQLNQYKIFDSHLNRSLSETSESQGGISVSHPPYGFGVAWFTQTTEEGDYYTPLTNARSHLKVQLSETQFNFSKTLLKEKLSIGLGAIVLRGSYENESEKASAKSVIPHVGILAQFYPHYFLGLSFRPGSTVRTDEKIGAGNYPGFSAPIILPSLFSFGVGYVPNRYFQTGLNFIIPFSQDNTALLADESVTVGKKTTLQPHVGAKYVLMEYKNFKIEVGSGFYYEKSRMMDRESRFHKTFSLDLNPYFMNTSFGIDSAPNYKNKIISLGVDIVRFSRFLELIPKDSTPPLNKLFPPPFKISNVGLPAGMAPEKKNEAHGPSLDEVKTMIFNLPEKIRQKFEGRPREKESRKNF